MTTIHNRHHNTAPKDAVYIGRGSPFGNPFIIGVHGNREEVCDQYEAFLVDEPGLLELVRTDLRGKDLVCFCAPSRCHGDTLIRIANEG